MEVNSILTGPEFTALVRSITLLKNPKLYPYNSADISLCSLDIETLTPLSKYVLAENLSYIDQLRQNLLAHGHNIFQLLGRLEVTFRGERIYLAPPIIEEWPDEGRLIVDGLHRMCLARRHGVGTVNCVLLRNVSLPLVPLPVAWKQIQEHPPGHYPQEKRVYRFNDFSEVAALEQAKDWGVTQENFRYFFFRDLSPLGSLGIREFPQPEKEDNT